MTEDDVALANALADAAGAAIRPFFRRRFTVEIKADASPVTEVDRAAEAAIRAILAERRPDDGVIGEEYGADRLDAPRTWVIDPIDGTRAFLAGRPLFGTLIALLEEDRPVLGVIDQPIAGERWLGAAGRPTTLNGAPATTRACAAPRHHRTQLLRRRGRPRVRAVAPANARHLVGRRLPQLRVARLGTPRSGGGGRAQAPRLRRAGAGRRGRGRAHGRLAGPLPRSRQRWPRRRRG